MTLSQTLELGMYQLGQLFLIPTLVIIGLLFIYAIYALGEFAMAAWQRRGRKPGDGSDNRCFTLIQWAQRHPQANEDELEIRAHRLIETPRIVTRVAPMLGLVATMIPMGPALKALSDGNLASVSDNLAIAFSAVIIALIAASLTFAVVAIRKRWLAEELSWLQDQRREQARSSATVHSATSDQQVAA